MIPAASPTGSRRAGGGLRRFVAAWLAESRGRAVAAAIVVVLVVGAAIEVSRRPSGQDEVVRAAPDSVTLLRARDPAALQKELVAALAHEGIQATTYTRLGRLGIDADLPGTVPASLREVLARHRIPLPTDGVLKVEIELERR